MFGLFRRDVRAEVTKAMDQHMMDDIDVVSSCALSLLIIKLLTCPAGGSSSSAHLTGLTKPLLIKNVSQIAMRDGLRCIHRRRVLEGHVLKSWGEGQPSREKHLLRFDDGICSCFPSANDHWLVRARKQVLLAASQLAENHAL
ncbi:hypothetical protein CROQUDRAFT_93948 [Cronartium quercuum f. sp. fusiforme G11]|uniref:Uncharacterized protein n=1 Tax=Cronartium quercuum f. sp. fusiforme G11 TaxID=708437 RepID=A0A9P6TAM0_9BASI|nr:hypothetical protein CROQUDRAFT_93948 [Cronartium quercuum f. sp. fusiforme G11]